MRRFSYEDFDLEVSPAGSPSSRRYRVRARTALGEVSATASAFDGTIGRHREQDLIDTDDEPRQRNRELGRRLHQMLFGPKIQALYQRLSDRARQQTDCAGVRIRLILTHAPELQALPWETIWSEDENRHLALSRATPLVRYIEMPEAPRQPLVADAPMRILLVGSMPAGEACLDIAAEFEDVRAALLPLGAQGMVDIKTLADTSLPALRRALTAHEVHVIHFSGHGGFDATRGFGYVVATAADGAPVEASGDEVAVLLRDCASLRLVVLNACETSAAHEAEIASGVAQALVRQGIPAVVAMQARIEDTAALSFSRTFYDCLARGFAVDAAVTEARIHVYLEASAKEEWSQPVLFMRARDGRLFDFERMQPPQVAHARSERPDSTVPDPLVASAMLEALFEQTASAFETARETIARMSGEDAEAPVLLEAFRIDRQSMADARLETLRHPWRDLGIGCWLLRSGRADEAIEILENGGKLLDPAAARFITGLCHLRIGRTALEAEHRAARLEAAVQAFEDAQPPQAEAPPFALLQAQAAACLMWQGVAHFVQHDLAAAFDRMKAALHASRGAACARPLVGMAGVRLAQGEFAEAEALMSEALEHDPACAEARTGMGEVLLVRGDWTGARELFGELVSDDTQARRMPSVGTLCNRLGLCHAAEGAGAAPAVVFEAYQSALSSLLVDEATVYSRASFARCRRLVCELFYLDPLRFGSELFALALLCRAYLDLAGDVRHGDPLDAGELGELHTIRTAIERHNRPLSLCFHAAGYGGWFKPILAYRRSEGGPS
jgi:tetratricopeptide (TPR) repeat protein